MEILRGHAHHDRAASAAAAADDGEDDGARLCLTIDGRAVQLDLPRFDTEPIHDGDEVIVAGKQRGDLLVAYAYKNVSTGRSDHSPSANATIALPLFTFLLALFYAKVLPGAPLAILQQTAISALVGTALFWYDVALSRAQFLVRRTALETIHGAVELCGAEGEAVKAGAPIARMAVGKRIVRIPAAAAGEIRTGDDLVIVGEPTPDGSVAIGNLAGGEILALAVRNVTRAHLHHSWTPTLRAAKIVLLGLGAVFMLVMAIRQLPDVSNDMSANDTYWMLGKYAAWSLGVNALSFFCLFDVYEWQLQREIRRLATS